MKFLIFKSKTTKAVYSYNGFNTVTILGSPSRPLGKIVNGFDNVFLDKMYRGSCDFFHVGDAEYQILTRI